MNTLGFCAGGIIQTTLLNHLAALGDTACTAPVRGHPARLRQPCTPRRLLGEAADRPRRADSRPGGVITARSMGVAFTWMRPDDLVFNYVVNQWLMGEDPPAFDILEWNADGTNLPAALHEQFLEIFRDNTLVRPGAMTVLGTPVDLATITVPTFVTGAMTDHLTPWTGCYRTTQLLSGPVAFVLSNSGHIQSLVNPPGNPKASYFVGGEPGPDPEDWRASAERSTGSWWENWAPWTIEQSGELVPAPSSPGPQAHPPRSPRRGCTCSTRFLRRWAAERVAVGGRFPPSADLSSSPPARLRVSATTTQHSAGLRPPGSPSTMR